jgi:hypothetical protein
MEEITTPEALPDAPQLSAADGGGADQPDSIPLAALKDVLGKDFKDADGALKSIQDTYKFVGSQGAYREKIDRLSSALGTDEQGVLSTLENLMTDINNKADGTVETPAVVPQAPQADGGEYVTKEEMFFMKNENIADLRNVLTPIKNSSEETKAMSWDQFVQSETAKQVIEPVLGYREVQSKKSVLDSSPRLGSAVDKSSQASQLVQEAEKAYNSGDPQTGHRAMAQARDNAVSSVIEAFDLK